MAVGRRDIFGLGAVGLGALAMDGCVGFLPWGHSAEQPDLDQLLRQLDYVIAHMKTLDPDAKSFGIKPGKQFDEGRATSLRLLTTLAFMGSYRHVPEPVWKEPKVAPRLAETLPEIYDTIRAARNHLVEMSDEECARIDEHLRKDPDLTMRIMERIDDYASQIHVPIEQRTYLRTSTAQLAGRFRFEGTKEVKKKLVDKYDRTLRSRKNELGFPTDAEPTEAEGQATQKLQARFVTRASPGDVRTAACAIEPKVTIDGVQRRVVIDSDEFRCAVRATPEDLQGTIKIEPGAGHENIVIITLDSTDPTLSENLHDIAGHLREVLAARSMPQERPLGGEGESCREKTDCEKGLECEDKTCTSPAHQPGSKRLIKTTGQVAKWGAILLIPPICAVGVLVLLVALFMVIVAGCMYTGGN